MAKQASLTVITSANNNATTLNSNFNALNAVFLDVLHRDGSAPNTMDADFDMNSQDLLNGKQGSFETLKLNGVLVTNLAAIGQDAGTWTTSTTYNAYDIVYQPTDLGYYIALEAHTSGVFATDLTNNLWLKLWTSNYDPSSVAITGGTIDGTVIGGTTPAAGDFTTLDATGAFSAGGTATITGDVDATGRILSDSNNANGSIRVDSSNPNLVFADTDVSGIVQMGQISGTCVLNIDPGNVDAASAYQMSIDGTEVFTAVGTKLAVGDAPGFATVTFEIDGTDAMLLPKGTTAQRPTGVEGYIRWNTDDNQMEGYDGTSWGAIAGSGGGGATGTFTGLRYDLNGGSTIGLSANTLTQFVPTEQVHDNTTGGWSGGTFTVPSSLDGSWVQVEAAVDFSGTAEATALMIIEHTPNGGSAYNIVNTDYNDALRTQVISPPFEVGTGDTIIVRVRTQTASTIANNEDSHIAIWRVGEVEATPPTQVTETITTAATGTITIPDGCTKVTLSGTAELATATADLNVQIRDTASSADTFTGFDIEYGTGQSALSADANVFEIGGTTDATRNFFMEITAPRDASKRTLVRGTGASDDESRSREGHMDTAEDQDEIHFSTSSGNITSATIYVEYSYG
jgi:hypothetical protein